MAISPKGRYIPLSTKRSHDKTKRGPGPRPGESSATATAAAAAAADVTAVVAAVAVTETETGANAGEEMELGLEEEAGPADWNGGADMVDMVDDFDHPMDVDDDEDDTILAHAVVDPGQPEEPHGHEEQGTHLPFNSVSMPFGRMNV